MLKPITTLLVSLLIFQISDLIAMRVGVATINSNGPYSTKIPELFIAVTTILCVVALGYFLTKVRHKLPLAIIIAAGLSNLLDRIIFGGVIDYINFFNISTINPADIAITISIIILLSLIIRNRPCSHFELM